MPSLSALEGQGKIQVPGCSGKLKDGDTIPVDFAPWAAEMAPIDSMIIEDNFATMAGATPKGTQLKPCITGNWTLVSIAPGFGGYQQRTYRFDAEMDLVFTPPPDLRTVVPQPTVPMTKATVYRHIHQTTLQHQYLWRSGDTFNPNTEWGTSANVTLAMMSPTPTQHGVVASSTLLGVMDQYVEAKLEKIQTDLYAELATEMITAGKPLAATATALDGAKHLWESYVALGLPMSLAQDDFLRSQLYGTTAVVTGSDDAGDGSLGNVENLYWYMSQNRPSANPRDAIFAMASTRVDTLAQTVSRILADLAAANETEGRSIVEPTMLRLALLAAQTP
jgi:hypothetical protein